MAASSLPLPLIIIIIIIISDASVHRADVTAEQACMAGQKCTAAFDIVTKSVQHGVLGFTLADYRSFCL